MWQEEKSTLSQQSHILKFCNRPMARKYVVDNEKLFDELQKLNKGDASQIMKLFKSFRGSQALLKLRELGCSITITKEDIKN